MKKRILSVLLIAILLLNVVPVPTHAAEGPTFVVKTVTANAGEDVDVTISVKNNPGIASIKLNVEYDHGLTLNSVTYNTAIGGISQQPQKMSNPVTLNWVNATANTNGDWVFATLSFAVAADATDRKYDIQISYEPDNVYNIAEENIFFEIENGAVMVGCSHDKKTEVSAKAADCTNNGNNLYYICDACDAVLKADGKTLTTVESETIPLLGHAFGEWGANGSNEDEERRDCKNCDYFETRKVGATTAPTFIVETVTANAGETVNVAISVKNNPGIASIKLNVEYDPDLVLNSITYNTAIGGISQQPQKMSNPVILNWVNATANTNGDWKFATLSFTVAEDAPDGKYGIQLSYEPDNVYNIAEEDIFFEIENGAILIGCIHDAKTQIPAKNADCVNGGNNLYYICNLCGAVFKSDGVTITTVASETIPALGHDWNAATCTEPKTCGTCGETEGTTIPHTFDQEKAEPKYLVSEGVYYKSCKCGEAGTETFTVSVQKPGEFKDVPANAYYHDAVMWAVENGITTGTGDGTTFEPNAICTRGQVVTFLWRAAGKPEPTTTTNPFTDVKSGDYFYKAVLWAVENRITNGTGDGTTFEPNANCNRAQIVTFLSRAKSGQPTTSNNPFKDVPAGSYYYNPVLWAVENKITTGTGDGTTFEPNSDCTRGQVITFLWRAYTK